MVAPFVKAPVLDSGDRLTRAEFHRRYLARPDLKRAELIGGVVYLPSPTRYTWHDAQAAMMITWTGSYAAHHPGVLAGGSATIYLDATSELQPDAFLFRLEPAGPGARQTEDGYLEGAPQLVVEVAASSASYDLHDKKEIYRRNAVREYLVWRVLDDAFDWFRLVNGEYLLVEPDPRGVIESQEFPGLRLNVPRLLAGDLATVLAELV
jgi:Uma2 family endonuclease